ncbi:MAG: hypothetical protein NTU53_15690 [Planctomycetota bacterium]|nr:hypothetical protein [Planctomycetota bacterium]
MTSRLLAMSRTRQALAAGGLRERGLGRGSGRGFSIVELMAVVVILLVLTGILVTVVSRSQRAAMNTRAKADLAVIGQALDQYAIDFKGMYPMSRDASGRPVAGEHLLAKALIGPGDDDGVPGPGFRTVAGGAPRSPYLDPGRFKAVWMNGQWEILDSFGTPIAYLPRRNSSKLAGTLYFGSNWRGMFDPGDILDLKDGEVINSDWPGKIDGSRIGAVTKCIAIVLADDDQNNVLGVNETLRHGGPFILISAGPEKKFWGDVGNIKKNDNLYNFDR